MNDMYVGLALRAARIKRHLRQVDLAAATGISAAVISRLEHGELDRVALRTLRAVGARLEIAVEILPRSQGGELNRVVNARHAALGESVAMWVAGHEDWVVAAEVSFAIYGERGIVDLLAWHAATGSVVVIELKTAIVDVNELLGTLDRKRRLAGTIASSRGWAAKSVSTWLIVGDSDTNRDRVRESKTMIASLLPSDRRSLAPLFRHPQDGPKSGVAFWANLHGAKVRHGFAAPQRVRKRSRSLVSDVRAHGKAGVAAEQSIPSLDGALDASLRR